MVERREKVYGSRSRGISREKRDRDRLMIVAGATWSSLRSGAGILQRMSLGMPATTMGMMFGSPVARTIHGTHGVASTCQQSHASAMTQARSQNGAEHQIHGDRRPNHLQQPSANDIRHCVDQSRLYPFPARRHASCCSIRRADPGGATEAGLPTPKRRGFDGYRIRRLCVILTQGAAKLARGRAWFFCQSQMCW